ncbi:MAG: hydrolase [Phycisphaeraceae bacterium]|nr:hydrolase [Phycisphaeraceae bacterium]
MQHRSACLCCGFLTIEQHPVDSYEVCPVCLWEADPVQAADPEYAGGANAVCLSVARQNVGAFGASERRLQDHVRPAAWFEWPV